MSDQLLTIKITAMQQQTGRPKAQALQVQECTSTHQLLESICGVLRIPATENIPLMSITQAHSRGAELDVRGKNTVHDLGIQNMDSLIVSFKPLPPRCDLEGRMGRISAGPVAESSRPKARKAAVAARPAIAEEEREITRTMSKQRQNNSQQKKKRKSTSAGKQKSNKKITIKGGGNELNSGNWIPGASTSGSERRKSRLEDQVSKLHSVNLGHSRIAAVDSAKYDIEAVQGGGMWMVVHYWDGERITKMVGVLGARQCWTHQSNLTRMPCARCGSRSLIQRGLRGGGTSTRPFKFFHSAL